MRTPPPAQGGKEILGTARSDLRDLREEQHGDWSGRRLGNVDSKGLRLLF